MSSTVTCQARHATWAVNTVGQDVCQQYAALLGVCDPDFSLNALTPLSPSYLPPSTTTARCACNLIAYNVASACRWCQDTLQPMWWVAESEWTARCTSLGQPFDGRGLPSDLLTANLTFSDWALNLTTTGGTWDPSVMRQIIAANNPSITDAVTDGPESGTDGTALPFVTNSVENGTDGTTLPFVTNSIESGTNGTALPFVTNSVESGTDSTALSSITNSIGPSPPSPDDPNSWGAPSAKDLIAITIGVVIFTLFLGSLIGFVLCRRQRWRKMEKTRCHTCDTGAGHKPDPK